MQKYKINTTIEDYETWFVVEFIMNWIQNNKPEVLQLAKDKYTQLVDEFKQAQELDQRTDHTNSR